MAISATSTEPPVQGPLLHSRLDAARRLGFSVRTLDSLTKECDLKPCRLRNRVLFREEELQRFVGACQES